MIPTSVARVLDAALARRPDATALVGPSGSLTYRELDAAADAAAGALWQRGVRPGDRVAACLPNDLDILVAFHGAQRIGAIWVGIGEALTAPEQTELATLADPRLVLAGPRWQGNAAEVMDLAEWTRARRNAPPAPEVATELDAPAGIAFTSGTTGRPKGVVHSQRNLLLPGAAIVAERGWGSDLRKGDSFALTILNMIVLTTLLNAQAQSCSVVTDRRHVEAIAEWINEERVDVWNGAPAQVYDLARRPELDVSRLREVWSGGGDTPAQLRAAFAQAHPGVPARGTYGLTEAPTLVAIDPLDEPARPGTSGRVMPHLDLAAYDDDGNRLGPDEVGELGLAPARSGPWAGQWTPMLGYWEDGRIVSAPPGPTATGDIGSVDADGWVTIVDRKKLVIVRGGANVYPAEVERVLTAHPRVAAAVVFGVHDERLGERVAALIQPTEAGFDGEFEIAQLQAACREQLARYKVPDVFATIERLPTNAMGKVIRTGLAALLDRPPAVT